MNTTRTLAALALSALLALSATGCTEPVATETPASTWEQDTSTDYPGGGTPNVLPGDDNLDGHIDEDESGWDCATRGNAQCGPTVAA